MMKFEPDRLGRPSAVVRVRGGDVVVSVDAIPGEPRIAAESALRRIEERWAEIEANLLRSLHKLYNRTWADPDQGFPELTEREFLAKITLNSITVSEDAVTLYFRDSDIFGGHSIELLFTSNEMYEAQLIG